MNAYFSFKSNFKVGTPCFGLCCYKHRFHNLKGWDFYVGYPCQALLRHHWWRRTPQYEELTSLLGSSSGQNIHTKCHSKRKRCKVTARRHRTTTKRHSKAALRLKGTHSNEERKQTQKQEKVESEAFFPFSGHGADVSKSRRHATDVTEILESKVAHC